MSKLIVLEGIDGSGTSTQIKRLHEAFQGAHISCHATFEPSDGPVGRLLRSMLRGEYAPVDATTMSLLFAADRADHINREVAPALKEGKVVLSDRWYLSSLAYQGSEEDRAWISVLNQRALRPDLTIFLSVAPEIAAERRAARGEAEEIYDKLETQRAIDAGYRRAIRELCDTEDIAIVDGEGSPAEVFDQICQKVAETCDFSLV